MTKKKKKKLFNIKYVNINNQLNSFSKDRRKIILKIYIFLSKIFPMNLKKFYRRASGVVSHNKTRGTAAQRRRWYRNCDRRVDVISHIRFNFFLYFFLLALSRAMVANVISALRFWDVNERKTLPRSPFLLNCPGLYIQIIYIYINIWVCVPGLHTYIYNRNIVLFRIRANSIDSKIAKIRACIACIISGGAENPSYVKTLEITSIGFVLVSEIMQFVRCFFSVAFLAVLGLWFPSSMCLWKR